MKFSNNTFFFVLDVGNSDIVISLIKNFKIYKIKRLKTKNFRNNNKVLFKGFNEIKNILKKQKEIDCLISSVVNEINKPLKYYCSLILKKIPKFVIFNKVKLNIKINVKNKSQVGADRLVNTVAIKSLYKTPALVIDFGTTTTFDIIDTNGNYQGGIISPGINLSLYNLFKKTSKLPLVKIKKNNNVIGKNTNEAIQNGLYWGYVGLVTFLIKKIQKKFKKKLYCVSTGGLSKMISKDIKQIDLVNENLTVYGLIEIVRLNCNE